ncbi:MAG TPA: PASTA domain-containing protein [Candidatus Methanoperedenaceae archaeon]|nr:PASTA domain-containing protein [Candidatus Methanoperedenaceae archaeon]
MAENYRVKYESLHRDFIAKEAEIGELKTHVKRLQLERSKIPSDRLVSSFGDALEKMQVALTEKSTRVKYLVSDMDVELRANVAFDDDKNEISYQLPKLDDSLPPENLSTIRFKIKMLPGEEVSSGEEVFDYDEVPNLLGLMQDYAKYQITSKRFTVGEISYEGTDRVEPGIVLSQIPSPFSLASPGSPVDITVAESTVKLTKVPNLIGLSLEEAEEVLKSINLKKGKVTKRKSESPPNTVISQSIKADEEVEIATMIDLVVAKEKEKPVEVKLTKVPNLVGRPVKKAEEVLKSINLKKGRITKRKSGSPSNTVISQSIKTDKEVETGSTIDLVVAAKQRKTNFRSKRRRIRPKKSRILNIKGGVKRARDER